MNKLFYLLIVLFLSSCGVKGNLYLPQEAETNNKIEKE